LPFSLSQQLSGGRSYVQTNFLASYKGGSFSQKLRKNRNPRWVQEEKLKEMVTKQPEKFYPLTLLALLCYYK
jgi:hypothetical protein